MQLNLAQIPSEIDTAEKLATWVLMLLHEAHPTLKTVESENISEYVAQASIIKAFDESTRVVFRVSLPLNSNYWTAGDPLWTQTKKLSDTAIPAAYLSES